MEPKEIVRYLTSQIETRAEIIKIPYCRGKDKGKKIESWINTEMLAKLLELKDKNEMEEVEGEHDYNIPKRTSPRRRYEHCDLWWKKDNQEHWLEVKTLVFHSNSDGLKNDYKERIKKDLDRVDSLRPPYNFHHLLMVFDDDYYYTGEWMEDVYAIYQDYKMKKEDKWKFDVNQRKTVHAFLHNKSRNSK
jgi:hypothetical protein